MPTTCLGSLFLLPQFVRLTLSQRQQRCARSAVFDQAHIDLRTRMLTHSDHTRLDRCHVIDINMHANVCECCDRWASHLQRGQQGGLPRGADALPMIVLAEVQLGEGGVHLHATSSRNGRRRKNGSRNANTVTTPFSEHEEKTNMYVFGSRS